jgi:hypothetical protein
MVSVQQAAAGVAVLCQWPQAVSDVKWRRFLNYDAFLACQALQTRGASNDKPNLEATNTAVSAQHSQWS